MAGIGKLIQGAGRDILGNVAKAVLCIRDVSKLNNVAVFNDLPGEVASAITDIKAVETDLMTKAEASLNGSTVSTYKDVKSTAGKNGYITLELQYNPSTIRLDSSAGQQMSYSGDPGDQQVNKHIAPASTTLSCDLLFDAVNQMDAFMIGDNPITGGLGLSSISKVANSVLSLTRKTFSVQPQMEGLLSMLAIPQARHVIFFWGDMCFRGEVTEVSADYTMFNKKGYPVRGTLSLQIRQGDGSDAATGVEKSYAYDETYWTKAFDLTFNNKQGGFIDSARKVANNSLLNLKF